MSRMRLAGRLLTIILTLGFLSDALAGHGRYLNREKGFSIEFPDGWKIMQDEMEATVLALSPVESRDDMFCEAVSVTVNELPARMTLAEYFYKTNELARDTFEDFKPEGSGTVRINDTEAKWIMFSYRMGQGRVRALGYCLVNGQRGFLITCDTEPRKFVKYRSQLVDTAMSFRFE